MGSKRLILARDIRLRSWPNIGDSYGICFISIKTLDQQIFCKCTLNDIKFTKHLVNVHKFTRYLIKVHKFTKYLVNSYHQRGLKQYILTN